MQRVSLNVNRALTSVAIGKSTYNALPRNSAGNQEDEHSRIFIGTFRKNQQEKTVYFLQIVEEMDAETIWKMKDCKGFGT